MDRDALNAIKAAVQKQRTFKVDIEGRGFTLVLPTPHERQVAYLQAGGTTDLGVWTIAVRRLLEASLVDWVNVTVDDIAGNGDNTVATFDRELVPLLLDSKTEWTAELSNELTARIAVHKQNVKGAKKKSVTTSPG